MPRTLLIGNPKTSWREWLKLHRGERDLICLDPADPVGNPPGRLTLHHGEKTPYFRFYGSLDPQRYPHVLLAGLVFMLEQAGPDVLIQSFAYRESPLLRHLLALVVQVLQPEEILLASGTKVNQVGFPVGLTEVDLAPAFPPDVQAAQRKAQWLKLIEECEEHEVEVKQVTMEGTRLGTGARLTEAQLGKAGLKDVLHAEASGGTLFLVSPAEPEDGALARALDVFHCSRANIVQPEAFDNLLCSFGRQSGEDFGMGMVQSFDFESGVARILCDAVAPAPVRILRLGSLRVDQAGRELGELRPWQV